MLKLSKLEHGVRVKETSPKQHELSNEAGNLMATYAVQCRKGISALFELCCTVAIFFASHCSDASGKGPFEVFKDSDGGVHFWAAPNLARIDECLASRKKRNEPAMMFASCGPRVNYYVEDLKMLVHFPGQRYAQSVNTEVTNLLSRNKRNKIRSIEVPFTDASDETVLEIDNCEALVNLDLGGTKITPASAASLVTLKHLENVAVNDTQIDGSVLRALSQLKNLKSISVGGTKLSYSDLDQFLKTQKLQKVFMQGLREPQGELNLDCETLELVDLSFNDLADRVHVKSLPQLKHLYLVDSIFGEAFISELKQLPDGTHVYLRDDKAAQKIPADQAQRLKLEVGRSKIIFDDTDDPEMDQQVFAPNRPSWRKR